ncbi:hypothetical protein CS954_16610 [Bacillus siamensis]|nr:hypothetical protein CS954_16610 [Bacillus siamensis]
MVIEIKINRECDNLLKHPILLVLLSVAGFLAYISRTAELSVPISWIVLLLGVALSFYSAVCLAA